VTGDRGDELATREHERAQKWCAGGVLALALGFLQRGEFRALAGGEVGPYVRLLLGLAATLWTCHAAVGERWRGWRRYVPCCASAVVFLADSPVGGRGVLGLLEYGVRLAIGLAADPVTVMAVASGPLALNLRWWLIMLPWSAIPAALAGIAIGILLPGCGVQSRTMER